MQKTVAFFLMLFFFPSLALASPAITFQKLHHDFGNLAEQEKEKEEYAFAFTNIGDQDLVIEKLTAS